MRRLVPIVAVAVAISCGGSPSGNQPHDSGVRGAVMMGPLCPVEVQGSPSQCPDQPVNGFVTASNDGGEVARVRTDVIGRFEMPLDPGTYTVVAVLENDTGAGPPSPVPQTVVVHEGSFTEVDLEVDTGIR